MGKLQKGIGDELTLYVRQLAWLQTAPEPEKISDKVDKKTRLEAIRDDGKQPLIPANPARYLTDWLFEIGPSVPSGGGDACVGYADIVAWQSVSGVEMEPWEARVIRRLSSEWINQKYNSRKMDCPAPWLGDDEHIAVNREQVAAKVRSVFGSKGRST